MRRFRRLFTRFGLLLLIGPGGLAAHPEQGRPAMAQWGAADFQAPGQLWRVRVLPDSRVVVAHNSGLSVYDGERFELLRPTSGRAYDVHPGPAGELSIGGPQGLGAWVPTADGSWSHQPRPLPAEAPAPTEIGRVLHAAGWTHYLARETVYSFQAQFGWRWQAARQRFAELRRLDGRSLLFEPGVGWWRFDEASGDWAPQDWPGFPLADLQVSSEDAGAVWYLSDRQSLWRYQSGRFERFAVDRTERLAVARIESLAALPDGGLAVGTRFAGYFQFDAAGRPIRELPPSQLPGERVSDIEVDRHGTIWLAIDGGLVRLAGDDAITRWDRSLGAFQVERIVRVDGVLRVPTRVGLKRLRPAEAPGEPARLELDRIERTSVWDVLETPAGGALVGAGNGLWWLPADGSPARHLKSGPKVSALVSSDPAVTQVYAVAGSRLWRVLLEADSYRVDESEVSALPMHDLRLHEGRLWASLDGAGGALSFGALDRWPEVHQRGYGAPEGLQGGRVLFSQALGPLLLLGNSNHQVDADGELREPVLLDGLPRLDQLLKAGPGRYWAVSVDGRLLRLRQEGPGAALSIDGQLNTALRLPTRHLWVDPDGTLWSGSDEGLARIAAEAGIVEWSGLRPHLARIDTPDQSLWAGAGVPSGPLAAPAGQRQLRFGLTLPGAFQEWPLQWSWRSSERAPWQPVAGSRLDWLAPSAGTHQLRFRAVDQGGREWIGDPIRLEIPPYWYEHPLGRAGSLLAAVLIAFLMAAALSHWRTRQLRMERARLEALVERRTAEVRRQAEEIRALSEARTRFFAHVSHEFRTPLTLVLGPVADALSGRHGDLPVGLRRALDMARRSAERLLRLVNELLDLSRLAAGRFDLHLARYDLAAQLRAELSALQGEAERRGIRLVSVGLADPLQLIYDADQLERMLSNLLGNALKFTPAGGCVTLRLVPTPIEVGIEVEDTGPGIPEPEQALIFERFRQGSAVAPPDTPGTGIGLALVRELVTLHHGRVELISTPGEGACFALWLPRNLQPTESGLPEIAIPVGRSGDAPPAPSEPVIELPEAPLVLVVDDMAEVRRYLADRLGDVYRVRTARDGDEALALIDELHPDVVVSDVMMPSRDGYALLRALRSEPETAGVPVLLLSARSRTRDVVAGLEAGADDYLVKPFEPAELLARIAALLERRRWLRRELLASGPSQATPEPGAAPAAPMSPEDDVSGSSPAAPTPAEQRFRERLEQLLSLRLGDPRFGVAEMAEALHVDRATLFRRLKSQLGTSPSDLLRERRLRRALELLRARRGTVSEVGYAVGYEALSHFAQAFRRRYGCAPSAVLDGLDVAD